MQSDTGLLARFTKSTTQGRRASPIVRCACGTRISRYAGGRCRACEGVRRAAQYQEAARIVATGACPQCGTPLVRNLSLTGWWQCGANGAVKMRRPEFQALAHCSFQTFTEC